jgi:hypothetical protein
VTPSRQGDVKQEEIEPSQPGFRQFPELSAGETDKYEPKTGERKVKDVDHPAAHLMLSEECRGTAKARVVLKG